MEQRVRYDPLADFAQSVRSATAAASLGEPRETAKANLLSTGTTGVAFIYRNGVVVAADRRVTAGGKISDHNFEKIDRLGTHSVITYACGVAFIQLVVTILRRHFRAYYYS